jgi:hypothetical protein
MTVTSRRGALAAATLSAVSAVSALALVAASQARADDALDARIDKFAEAGKDITRISASLAETQVDDLVPDSVKKRSGLIKLVREGDGGKIRIDIVGAGGKPEERYLYDGTTFYKVNFRTKSIAGFRAAPGKKPKDVFKLGRGPFPLPVGQKRAEIAELFKIDAADPMKDKSGAVVPGSFGVKLTPKPEAPYAREYESFVFKAVEGKGVPEEVISRSKSGLEKTIRLENLKTNADADIPADAFTLDPNSAEFKGFQVDIKTQG